MRIARLLTGIFHTPQPCKPSPLHMLPPPTMHSPSTTYAPPPCMIRHRTSPHSRTERQTIVKPLPYSKLWSLILVKGTMQYINISVISKRITSWSSLWRQVFSCLPVILITLILVICYRCVYLYFWSIKFRFNSAWSVLWHWYFSHSLPQVSSNFFKFSNLTYPESRSTKTFIGEQ